MDKISLLLTMSLLVSVISAQTADFTDPRDNQTYRTKTFEKDLGLVLLFDKPG